MHQHLIYVGYLDPLNAVNIVQCPTYASMCHKQKNYCLKLMPSYQFQQLWTRPNKMRKKRIIYHLFKCWRRNSIVSFHFFYLSIITNRVKSKGDNWAQDDRNCISQKRAHFWDIQLVSSCAHPWGTRWYQLDIFLKSSFLSYAVSIILSSIIAIAL